MFWAYFKRLNYLLISQPGVLQGLVRGASGLLDAVREDIVCVQEQFLPNQTEQLNEMARSRGLFQFPGESERSYRYRLVNAYQWWKLTQSESGLAQILMDYSGLSNLRFENLDDPLRWAEFTIDADICGGFDRNQWNTLVSAIDELKPARSKIAGINLNSTTEPILVDVAFAVVSGIDCFLTTGDATLYYCPLSVSSRIGVLQTEITILLNFQSNQTDVVDCGVFDNPAMFSVVSGTYQTVINDMVDCGQRWGAF